MTRRICFCLRFENPHVQGGLGDMLALEFHLRHLVRTLEATELVLVTDAAIAARHGEFFRRHSVVTRLVACPAIGVKAPLQWLRFYARMRRHPCSLVVVGGARNPFGLHALLCGIPERVGIAFNASERRFLTRHVHVQGGQNGEADLVEYVAAYSQAMGIADPGPTGLETPQLIYRKEILSGMDAQRPIVAVHPGGSHHFNRRWPPQRYAEFCRRIARELDGTVYLLGGESEREDCEAVRAAVLAAVPDARVYNLTGLSIDQSASYLANADVFVGNDSGFLHVAAALAMPIVAVFGPSNPAIWRRAYPTLRVVSRPYGCHAGSFARVRHRARRTACLAYRCTYAYDPSRPSYPECLLAVTVEDVWQQVRSVLSYGMAASRTSSGSSR